jgi:lipoprotein NlpI
LGSTLLSRAVVGKQLQERWDDCSKASSLSPKIPQIFGYRGFVYLKLGQFDKALVDYDAAFSLTENSRQCRLALWRGVAKVRKGDATGGNADIEKAKHHQGRHRG